MDHMPGSSNSFRSDDRKTRFHTMTGDSAGGIGHEQKNKEDIIRQYIQAYNGFNTDAVLALVHPDITFQNISHGEINARTHGKSEFEALARQSATLFTKRSQSL